MKSNLPPLTQEEWEILDKYFGNLLRYTCIRINGDLILADNEDLLQDLRITLIESVEAYLRMIDREYGENVTFSQAWDDSYYRVQLIKYVKTCIFNSKNKKGKRLTKRMGMVNKTHSIHLMSDLEQSFDHEVTLIEETIIREISNILI